MATYNPKRKINSAGTLEEINFRAKYDGDGNEIVATYATKEELGQTESVANSAAQEASSAFNMASSAANEASSASSLANEAKTAADGASNQIASMQTEVSDLNSRVTTLENDSGSNVVIENPVVPAAYWQELDSATYAPYTHGTIVSIAATIGQNTRVKLFNDNPVLFAKHGFAINAVVEATGAVYIGSIGLPEQDITFTIGIER